MERGVYFDGWLRREHCYHPSLPQRHLSILDDLAQYHATVLTWAGMGGGSISLPFLHHEAFGPIDPRMQIYGYMNDSEFIAECNRHGIRLFGIVFEAQGWEYPAVMDKDGYITRMNKRAEEDPAHAWYGLREFSADMWPNAFPTSLKDYYPDGIRNEEGQLVENLWEECAVRDMHGSPMLIPAIVTAAIFVFLQVWNELLLATVLTTNNVRTLTVGIKQMSGQYQTEYGPMGAGLVIATLPTLILYCCMSSQVQKSLVSGAVKG